MPIGRNECHCMCHISGGRCGVTTCDCGSPGEEHNPWDWKGPTKKECSCDCHSKEDVLAVCLCCSKPGRLWQGPAHTTCGCRCHDRTGPKSSWFHDCPNGKLCCEMHQHPWSDHDAVIQAQVDLWFKRSVEK